MFVALQGLLDSLSLLSLLSLLCYCIIGFIEFNPKNSINLGISIY